MADIKEIAKDVGLIAITGPFGKLGKALTQALKKHKEAKDKKEKARLQKLIDDLKKEITQKKARATSRKQQRRVGYTPHQINPITERGYENIEWVRKQKEKGMIPVPLLELESKKVRPPKINKKGGTVSKYSKGGGVRTAKYKV